LLSSLGTKIFLDRYAKKSDPSRSFAGSGQDFAEGDGVLARHQGQSFASSGLLGTVVSVSPTSVELKLESGETITSDKSNVTKPTETLEMMFQRVSAAVASAEKNKEKWTCEFFHLLSGFFEPSYFHQRG